MAQHANASRREPALLPVPEAPTMGEAFEDIAERGLPFVVRGCAGREFCVTREAMKRRLEREDVTTFAFRPSTLEQIDGLSVARCVADWEKGTLDDVSFLDSPIPGVVDPDLLDPGLRSRGICSENAMLVLNRGGNYTPFHVDTIGREDGAGGWMYLIEGRKYWQMIDYSDASRLIHERRVRDLAPDDLIEWDDGALRGKIYHASVGAGDALYFPPGMVHRVWTHAPSIGICGYARCASDAERVPKVAEWLTSHGVSVAYGLWDGGTDV